MANHTFNPHGAKLNEDDNQIGNALPRLVRRIKLMCEKFPDKIAVNQLNGQLNLQSDDRTS
jgi:hypothetical protein